MLWHHYGLAQICSTSFTINLQPAFFIYFRNSSKRGLMIKTHTPSYVCRCHGVFTILFIFSHTDIHNGWPFNPLLFSTENGFSMFLWLGHNIDQDFIQEVFGVSSLAQINIETCVLVELDNPRSQRVAQIISKVRSQRSHFMKVDRFIRIISIF